MRFQTAGFLVIFSVLSALVCHAAPGEREKRVREDKQKMDADRSWIYNDLDEGKLVAQRDEKPLLVVFRCIP
jgi:hypothetical protein